MAVWELRNADVNDYAMLVLPVEDEDIDADKVFGGTGAPLKWRKTRRLEVFVGKRRKLPQPRADVSAFMPGALVLNERAFQALSGFLAKFGQLLPLSVDGQPEYFYNVTHLVNCVDPSRSRKRSDGSMAQEAFDEAAVPDSPAVFKDPSTAVIRIYVNATGKDILDELIAKAGLTGLEAVPVGM